ncbi:MAG: hypothetical protein QOJ15_45 [Bradyrhizobium sp.]|nr:hypothetical protein [Bradyrhizobium sp.]
MTLHISFGITILVMIVARLIWRITHPVAPESSLPLWQRVSSEAVHWLLYAIVLAATLTGWLFASLRGWSISYFYSVPLPMLATKNTVAIKQIDGWHQIAEWRCLFWSASMSPQRWFIFLFTVTASCKGCCQSVGDFWRMSHVALPGSSAGRTRRPLRPWKQTLVGCDDDRSAYEFTALGKSEFDGRRPECLCGETERPAAPASRSKTVLQVCKLPAACRSGWLRQCQAPARRAG